MEVQQVIPEATTTPPVEEKVVSDSVLCNCWAYSKQVYPSLPPTKTIHANLQQEPAEIAVFQYGNLPHYAIVTSVGTSTFDITETNFKACEKTKRTISLDDPSLKGFYKPI